MSHLILLDDPVAYSIIVVWPYLPAHLRKASPYDLAIGIAGRIKYRGPYDEIVNKVRLLIEAQAIFMDGTLSDTIQTYMDNLDAAKLKGLLGQAGDD